MKNTRIILIISTIVFIAMLWVRQSRGTGELSGYDRYYVFSVLTISGIVALIALIRHLSPTNHRSRSQIEKKRYGETQKRAYYRIEYQESPHPRFVSKSTADDLGTEFSCPVYNVSETGISLICRGIFSQGETVQGQIIFHSGRTAPINGVVLRVDDERTNLRLHCTIDPQLLMAEQREQIIREKENGPQPVVSEALGASPEGSLPSHRPKGICRLKDS